MELSAAVRRRVYVEGWSERAAARRVGLARGTVRKMLRSRQPSGYRRQKPIRCPKLEAFTGVIDQILRDDQHRPKKQRHTATRICARLRGMSRALLKLSGSLVHDYATISDDSPSPNRASRARRAATSAGIS